MKKIILISPRGFCAGVKRAIEIVERALAKFGPPVCVYHEIVHNNYVVESLKKRGAIFIDDIKDCIKDRPIIFSAHGVSKDIVDEAKSFQVFDATCPLVFKVHKDARKLSDLGYQIILIGHKNHPEVIGTMGQVENIILVETIDDVIALPDLKNVAVITQTTLSIDDTKEISDAILSRFKDAVLKNDICYATTNRQEALKNISSSLDRLIVVGSKKSSNSNRLVETGKLYGCSESRLLNDYRDLDFEWLDNSKTIGITAGASAPEVLIEQIISEIKKHYEIVIEEFSNKIETTEFLIPKDLR